MANGYYTASSKSVSKSVRALSKHINDVNSAIETAFDDLPTEEELKELSPYIGVDSGAANAYVVARTNTISSLTDGQQTVFKAGNTNTGASTINVDSQGVKSIVRPNGDALEAGDITANYFVTVRYNSTNDKYEIQNSLPSIASEAAASAAAAASSASDAAADLVLTNADVVSTNADVVSTNADVVTTGNNVTSCQTAQTAAETAETNAETAEANAENIIGTVGLRFDFDDSTSMADPGTGLLRLDNATIASATNIAIDISTADTGNPDVSDYIDTWDGSTNTIKGHLILRKVGTANFFAIFTVSSVTDNTDWLQIAVTYVDGNGTLTDADELVISFIRAGDAGSMTELADDTTPQLGGSLDGQDNEASRLKFKDIGHTLSAIGNTGATQTFDCEVANVFTCTLDQACTFTFSNPPASGIAGSLTIIGTNLGAFTITWPASVDWESATAPTLTAAGVDVLSFVTPDGGTTWLNVSINLDVS